MFNKILTVLLGIGAVTSLGIAVRAYGEEKYLSGRIDQAKEVQAELEQIRKEIDEECNSLEES